MPSLFGLQMRGRVSADAQHTYAYLRRRLHTVDQCRQLLGDIASELLEILVLETMCTDTEGSERDAEDAPHGITVSAHEHTSQSHIPTEPDLYVKISVFHGTSIKQRN